MGSEHRYLCQLKPERKLQVLASLCLGMQATGITAEQTNSQSSTTGSTTGVKHTAALATELADTCRDLKHYVGLNKSLLQQYSCELLHVQSLAAQLVQMSNLQHA